MRSFHAFLLTTVAAIFCVSGESALPQLGQAPVEAVIAAMTPREKVGLIVGDGRFLLVGDPAKTEKGVGRIVENGKWLPVVPRLSIFTSVFSDGPAGVNQDPLPPGATAPLYTTAFPVASCLAATWDVELLHRVGEAIGDELLAYGYDAGLMPSLNLVRNPRCGRNFEYYSEDPLLSGKMAAAMTRGIQSRKVGATLKVLLANNQETNRRRYNAVISQRALRELYLRGFEIAVKESRPQMIMTAYNKVNGFYASENPDLLRTIVRGEWGFKGVFITDYDGEGSAVAKVRAGANLLMSGARSEFDELLAALKDKTLSEQTLDASLVYLLNLKLQSPRISGYVPSMKPNLASHARIAREAALEGMVLLKNAGHTLPLVDTKTVAVFGKMSYFLVHAGTGSGTVRSSAYSVSVNDGLKAAGYRVLPELEAPYLAFNQKIIADNLVPDYFTDPVQYPDGKAPPYFKARLVPFHKEMKLSREHIARTVARSDAAVLTIGRSGGENYENGYLPISDIERKLLQDVCETFHAAGKKVVVVLNVGNVFETASWRELPDAILLAWQPGQEGGHAIADVLSGKVNPSGKLPVSFPIKYADVPSAPYFPGEPPEAPVNSFYNEGIYVGYRYYDSFHIPVAYPFGFGMSYTSFEYGDLTLNTTNFTDTLKVKVTVTNTGKMAGREVVQLYLAAPDDVMEKPVQELKGFAKTRLLQPDAHEEVAFTLDLRALASFQSGASAWVADAGTYEVRIGSSSRDIRLRTSFTLAKPVVVEKVSDVMFPNFAMQELRLKKP
jgi:beta-glucosidase